VLAGVLCATALPASAQDRDVRRQVVYIGDVDRYTEAGADAILDRIDRAAHNVCDAGPGLRPIAELSDVHACRTDAREDAVRQVNSPVVTAMYYGYTPQVIVADDEYSGDAIIVKKPA
jgi:UrcA family protein